MIARTENIIGRIFYQLTVITQSGNTCTCQCSCGNITESMVSDLMIGHKKSCGCRKRNPIHSKTHGLSGTSIYTTWMSMKARCNNPNDQAYSDYGARGITVCDTWNNSFEDFVKDMGERPSLYYSIDRMDNDKGYCPSNCRWATKHQQNSNRRTTFWIEHDGRKQSMTDWALELGIDPLQFRHHALTKSIPEIVEHFKNKKGEGTKKPLVQYSLDGIEIRTFTSLKEAVEITGIQKSNLGMAAQGIRPTAGGFKWKYL